MVKSASVQTLYNQIQEDIKSTVTIKRSMSRLILKGTVQLLCGNVVLCEIGADNRQNKYAHFRTNVISRYAK